VSPLWVASYIVLWVVVAALAVVMTGLLRQFGIFQMRFGDDPGVLMTPEGLNRGVVAPDFEAIDLRTQRPIHLSAFHGRRVLLVFLTTSCSSCHDLVPHLNDIARDRQNEVDMIVVCYGDGATCAEFARQTDLRPAVVADPTNAIATRYETQRAPFAFLIDATGTILIRGVVNTWPQLEAILKEEGTFQRSLWHPTADDATTADGDRRMDKVVIR